MTGKPIPKSSIPSLRAVRALAETAVPKNARFPILSPTALKNLGITGITASNSLLTQEFANGEAGNLSGIIADQYMNMAQMDTEAHVISPPQIETPRLEKAFQTTRFKMKAPNIFSSPLHPPSPPSEDRVLFENLAHFKPAPLAAAIDRVPGENLWPYMPGSVSDIVGKTFAPFVDSIQNVVDAFAARVKSFFGIGSAPATAAVQSGIDFVGLGERTNAQRMSRGEAVALAAAAGALVTGCGFDDATAKVFTEAIVKAFGGLGLFLYGMKFMGDELKSVSGTAMKKLLAKLTSNRFSALLIGAVVTSIIQSSSVTTVLTVGLVDAGFMNLVQALGVVFGANIGTTMTGWLFSLKITKYSLPMIFISMFPGIFSKNQKANKIGKAILGLGLVFLGLTTMSAGFKDPVVNEFLRDFFSGFSGGSHLDILKCILAAAVATEIVQSSSATLGVTIALAKAGVIPFETAAGLVLGLNIGTTITAILAAIRPGVTKEARQVALSHFLFNFIGVTLIFPFSPQFIEAVESIMGSIGVESPASQVAFVHSFYNIMASALFISVLGPFKEGVVRTSSGLSRITKFFARIWPSRWKKKAPDFGELSQLLLETPGLAVERSREAVLEMGPHVEKMFDNLLAVVQSSAVNGNANSNGNTSSINMHEAFLDARKANVREFLGALIERRMSRREAEAVARQLRVASEYENVGDDLFRVLKQATALGSTGIALPEDVRDELYRIHGEVFAYFQLIKEAVDSSNTDILRKATSESKRLKGTIVELIKTHQTHIDKNPGSPEMHTSIYIQGMLRAYYNIISRAKNIAEALAGKKVEKPPE